MNFTPVTIEQIANKPIGEEWVYFRGTCASLPEDINIKPKDAESLFKTYMGAYEAGYITLYQKKTDRFIRLHTTVKTKETTSPCTVYEYTAKRIK